MKLRQQAAGTAPTEEVGAWAADLRGQGEDGFFSLNRYLFGATKPAVR